jgi:hypothetical protein
MYESNFLSACIREHTRGILITVSHCCNLLYALGPIFSQISGHRAFSFVDTHHAYIGVTKSENNAIEVYKKGAVRMRVLANQVIPFYIQSPFTNKKFSEATDDFLN